eukprot:Gb_39013 [translate_table: standard]
MESIRKLDLKSTIEEFYDLELPEDDELRSFGWMMALDALFILEILQNDYSLPVEVDNNGPLDIRSLEGCIKCDFLKLENQIPLFILERVYVEMGRPLKRNAACESRTLEETLKKTCLALSPFVSKRPMDSLVVSFQDGNHFLGLMHRHVSDLVEIQPIMEMQENVSEQEENVSDDNVSEQEEFSICFRCFGCFRCLRNFRCFRCSFRCFRCFRQVVSAILKCIDYISSSSFPPPGDDFQPTYNVQELSKAGIKFKAFSSHSEKIRFEKTTGTLHLPVITISDTTEIILRNLLALEFNNPNGTKHVTRYVELMDCLIGTPEDISSLKKIGVVQQRSLMQEDADIANRWNGMCQPFFAGFHEPPPELKDGIKEAVRQNYWKSKIRNVLFDVHQIYSSRPWQLLALLCLLFLLLADTTQTYCLFGKCGKFKQGLSTGFTPGPGFHFPPPPGSPHGSGFPPPARVSPRVRVPPTSRVPPAARVSPRVRVPLPLTARVPRAARVSLPPTARVPPAARASTVPLLRDRKHGWRESL